MKKANADKEKARGSSKNDLEEMRRLLKALEKSLRAAEAFSGKQGFSGCQRTLLHMISHTQTLAESLRSEKPGFA